MGRGSPPEKKKTQNEDVVCFGGVCSPLPMHGRASVWVFFFFFFFFFSPAIVCICAVHIPQSSGAESMTRSLRLYGFWKQREIDLACERGEVKVHYTEGWAGLKLQTGGWPWFHCMDETKGETNRVNSKQMSLVFSPHVTKYWICQLFFFKCSELR